MNLELEQKDLEFIESLLETERDKLMIELNHTDRYAYKEIVKERERQVEQILQRLH